MTHQSPARPPRDSKLDDEMMFIEYASGTLDTALCLVIDSYLEISRAAQERLAHCEHIGGLLMETQCTPVDMAEDSLNNLLARLDGDDTGETAIFSDLSPRIAQYQNSRHYHEHMPQAVCAYLAQNKPRARWVKMGRLSMMDVPFPDSHYKITLVHCHPGARIGRHSHDGTEITLILQGAFSDANGRFSAGDLVIYDQHDHAHAPVACPEQGCFCIVATDAPPRYPGIFGKLISFLYR